MHADLEGLDGISRKNPDALLTHNGPGVVLGIHEMHRRTGLRLPVSKHRFDLKTVLTERLKATVC